MKDDDSTVVRVARAGNKFDPATASIVGFLLKLVLRSSYSS
jgi:hypothetical protein